MTQARTHGERWFGGGKSQLYQTGGANEREVHREEFGSLWFTVHDGALTLKLPYDVRNYTTGQYGLTVWNNPASTQNILIVDGDSGAITNGTVTPGQSAMILLEANESAAGSWHALVRTAGPVAVLS